MVRLERILYEKAINSNLIGRARKIAKPATWYDRTYKDYNSTVFWPGGYAFRKLMQPLTDLWTSNEYKHFYQNSKVQGAPMSDYLALKEEDWRRGLLAENMKRENLHPWMHIQHIMMRSRYWKVDKFMKGFEVPDYVLEETHGEALIDSMPYADAMQSVLFEYTREMMPRLHMFRSRRVILDIIIIHGLIDRKNWNRLFYNEAFYTDELLEIEEDEKRMERAKDFTQQANQQNFRSWMEAKMARYPGVFTREGEPFDYDTFFRNHAAVNGHLKPSEEMSQNEIDKLRERLTKAANSSQLYSDVSKKILRQDREDEEIIEGKNTVGIKMPEEITPMKYKAWMA